MLNKKVIHQTSWISNFWENVKSLNCLTVSIVSIIYWVLYFCPRVIPQCEWSTLWVYFFTQICYHNMRSNKLGGVFLVGMTPRMSGSQQTMNLWHRSTGAANRNCLIFSNFLQCCVLYCLLTDVYTKVTFGYTLITDIYILILIYSCILHFNGSQFSMAFNEAW